MTNTTQTTPGTTCSLGGCHRTYLEVACSTCKAGEGRKCRTPRGKPTGAHARRRAYWVRMKDATSCYCSKVARRAEMTSLVCETRAELDARLTREIAAERSVEEGQAWLRSTEPVGDYSDDCSGLAYVEEEAGCEGCGLEDATRPVEGCVAGRAVELCYACHPEAPAKTKTGAELLADFRAELGLEAYAGTSEERKAGIDTLEAKTVEPKAGPRHEPRVLTLVACGKTKLDHAAKAEDLYTGNLFRARRRWAEAHGDAWAILSAKHGVTSPSRVLEPYDKSLAGSKKRVREGWASTAAADLVRTYGTPELVRIHAGAAYARVLCWELERRGIAVEWISEGLQVGEQLRQLNELVAGLEAEAAAPKATTLEITTTAGETLVAELLEAELGAKARIKWGGWPAHYLGTLAGLEGFYGGSEITGLCIHGGGRYQASVSVSRETMIEVFEWIAGLEASPARAVVRELLGLDDDGPEPAREAGSVDCGESRGVSGSNTPEGMRQHGSTTKDPTMINAATDQVLADLEAARAIALVEWKAARAGELDEDLVAELKADAVAACAARLARVEELELERTLADKVEELEAAVELSPRFAAATGFLREELRLAKLALEAERILEARAELPAWTRSGGKCKTKARYALGATGWAISHCGHPTAHRPFMVHAPNGEGYVADNGGAWSHLGDAKLVAERLAVGATARSIPHSVRQRLVGEQTATKALAARLGKRPQAEISAERFRWAGMTYLEQSKRLGLEAAS